MNAGIPIKLPGAVAQVISCLAVGLHLDGIFDSVAQERDNFDDVQKFNG